MTHVLSARGGGRAVCWHLRGSLAVSSRPLTALPHSFTAADSHRGSHKGLCERRPDQKAKLSLSRPLSGAQHGHSQQWNGSRAAATSSIAVGTSAGTVDQILPLPRAASSLPARALFGSLLGLTGALIILAGGWVYTAATSLAVYQACQEFQGFLNSKGISEDMKPPSPLVNTLTSLLCVGFTVFAHISNGNSTAALAVTAFAVLSLQLVAVKTAHFSQITSSVFGLFYCGMCS